MPRKSKEIATSRVFLKIEPPKKKLSNYLRIFLMFIFLLFSWLMFYTLQWQDIFVTTLGYVVICIFVAFILMRLRPRALLFAEKGITDGLFISVLWEELEAYNFVSLPDIGPNKGRRVLRLISNEGPFYDLRFMGLPRNLYDRGLFFTEAEMEKAEEIFQAKGIAKEK